MKRNVLKVVCNPCTNRISYYFKNEFGEWNVMSENSPLSRNYYTNSLIGERSEEILEKIDEIYNRKNKGVDIIFEGTRENYNHLLKVIEEKFDDRDIICKLGRTKIAVVGKKSVGKSFLIEGIESLQKIQYSRIKKNEYEKYVDEYNNAEWYEVSGIDFGKDKVETAFETVRKLSEDGLSTVIYCISATAGRIEEIEKNLIKRIADNFAELKVMIVLTMCYKEDIQEEIDEIEKITNQVKTIPVLAKGYKTGLKNRNGEYKFIDSFGLEEVSKFVFEGR